jgi:hypothetical protein
LSQQVLAQVRGHRLYAMFHLVALRGLRRGEAAGLRWIDLDFDAGTLTVAGQLQQLGGRLIAEPPKSGAGRRVIAWTRPPSPRCASTGSGSRPSGPPPGPGGPSPGSVHHHDRDPVPAGPRVGFGIADIRDLLAASAGRPSATRQWRELATRKLPEISALISDLTELRAVIAAWPVQSQALPGSVPPAVGRKA